MKKIFALAIVGALSVASMGAAQASDIRGRIEKVDTEANTIKLKNGVMLHYGDDVNEADLKPGASIKARYDSVKGVFEVKSLTVVSKD